MGKQDLAIKQDDVTDVYSAILSTDVEDIAKSLFSRSGTGFVSDDPFLQERRDAAALRISKIMWLIASLQPDLEFCANEPIKPWSPNDISLIRKRSWPKVLGMRVTIPGDATKEQKAQLVSNILEGMAGSVSV